VLVPTLTTFHDLAERFAKEFAPALVAQAERQRDEAYETLTAAHDAGVVLAMGFDSGPPGTNVLELMRMVDGGLTAAEAIVAATAGSARALGLADRGILEVGKVADLVAVDGDPLEEPGLLCDPGRLWLIARAGVVVAGMTLAPSP
jgi:imidazolonepropionase-like amidohydrolase